MADPIHVADYTTITSLASATFSSFHMDVKQNAMSRFPYLDTIMGRPGRNGRSRLTTGMFGSSGMKSVAHKVDSGLIIYLPINYKEPSPGAYIQHLDQWTYTREDYNTLMQYPWRYHATEIVCSYQEKWENRTGQRGVKVLDIVNNRIKQKTTKALQDINEDLITATGGDNLPDGLAALFPSDPTVAGTTIGGIDVSVYTDLRPKYNADLPGAPAAGSAGDFPSQYRDAMINALNDCMQHQEVEGSYLWLVGQDIWESYFGIQHAKERAMRSIDSSNQTATGSEGYTELFFQGIPMIWDPAMPNGEIYLLNLGSLCLFTMQDAWGYMLPWRELENRAGRGTALIHGFQQGTNQPKSSGHFDGWTT